MSERRDDTTEPAQRGDAPLEPERQQQNYYYDDGTNYEVYDAVKSEEEDDESGRSEKQS